MVSVDCVPVWNVVVRSVIGLKSVAAGVPVISKAMTPPMSSDVIVSGPTAPLRIVVADDHPLFRKGMVAMLSAEPGLEIVGEAVTGVEAVERVLATGADVVLMDLQMPEMGGIAAIRELRQQAPEVRILVVTLFEDDDSVFLSLRAGAQG